MKVSTLIKELERLKKIHGDIAIQIDVCSWFGVTTTQEDGFVSVSKSNFRNGATCIKIQGDAD